MTVLGYIILAAAVGLLIAGFMRKALFAALACIVGSIGLALLFDGVAIWLFLAGVLALVAMFFSLTAARVIVVIGVILTLVVGWPFGIDWNDNTNTTTSGASPSSSPSVQKSPDECVDKYNVVLDKNAGNRVLSDGLPNGTAEQKRDYVVAKAQHDPRVLQLAWNVTPAGAKHPVTVAELVDDGCYSETGRDLYQQTKGVYEAAAVVIEDAPASGNNTGVANGTPFQEPGHISGNRSGIKVTFHGTKHSVWVMNRCGNIVTSTPIPKVPNHPKKCPNGSPMNPNGTCAKDPSKDVLLNPAVPDQVKGPGTTPVGTDPGPATQTYDTPTGCNGPCPRPSNAPLPSATATRPPGDPNGGSGNGGATPGPGPTDDSDAGQTTSPAPSASSGPICGTGNPDDC